MAQPITRHDRSAESRRPAGVRWIALAGLGTVTAGLVSCFGCASTVIPPADLREPEVVYLADYGRHASLIMPRDEATLVEYSYGEWQWYALTQQGVFGILRSMLLPTQGALGRRNIALRPGEVWWGDLGLENLYELQVEQSDVDALLARLDERWDAAAETRLYNHLYDLEFVHDPQLYLFINNSNPTTARWLKELGCTVCGPALISNWRIAE